MIHVEWLAYTMKDQQLKFVNLLYTFIYMHQVGRDSVKLMFF